MRPRANGQHRRMLVERAALLPLPATPSPVPRPNAAWTPPLPIESLQHPLSVYDELLELRA